jgi:hypothetical protein
MNFNANARRQRGFTGETAEYNGITNSVATNAQPDAPAKRKRGRPKKFIDLELVKKLAHIQCTYNEIASTLGVSVDTLMRHKDFAATYKEGAEGGRKSLRRMQFESANRGNVVMQIWLGKQYLNQSDHGTIALQKLQALPDMSPQQLGRIMAAMSSTDMGAIIEAMEAQLAGVTNAPREPSLPALPAPTSHDHVVAATFTVESNNNQDLLFSARSID